MASRFLVIQYVEGLFGSLMPIDRRLRCLQAGHGNSGAEPGIMVSWGAACSAAVSWKPAVVAVQQTFFIRSQTEKVVQLRFGTGRVQANRWPSSLFVPLEDMVRIIERCADLYGLWLTAFNLNDQMFINVTKRGYLLKKDLALALGLPRLLDP